MTAPANARSSAYRIRRRRDLIIAAAIAFVVIVAAVIVYLTSDVRATTDNTGPGFAPTAAMAAVPAKLAVAWQQRTDPSVGAAVSAYGTVATTDQHAVTGRDAVTGAVRWSYARSNESLCAVGSNDTSVGTIGIPQGSPGDDHPVGFLALYATGGMCQEMVLLHPQTGDRRYQRTSPNEAGGTLIFGGPYAAWVGTDRMEVWGSTLLRTIQYGNQPDPDAPGYEHLGCTFTDAAVTDNQFGTIEHCPSMGPNARIVLNWDDPNSHDHDKWSVYKHVALMDVNTGSTQARIVGITADRVAVLVSTPTPAIVIYGADGKIVSRTPVQIPASAFGADSKPTPRVTLNGVQYALAAGYLIAVGNQNVKVTVPITTTATTTAPSTDGGGLSGLLSGSAATPTKPTTEVQDRATPVVNWVLPSAIGLPALVGTDLAVPSKSGLMVVPTAEGTVSRTVPVARTGSPSRVDVDLVEDRLVELRGDSVVALKAASGTTEP